MIAVDEFLDFVSGVFEVPRTKLSLETTYGSIPEWDSMAQLRLVMEIAATFGKEIPFSEVTVVRSLWDFWRRINNLPLKKVVAIDLDNTLWSGVIGEDGLDALVPNEDLIRTLRMLKERGILIVVLSKNNEADGLAGISKFFGKENLVGWCINWQPKADNLRSIAEELNLGVDSFVFVDDNPAERLAMMRELPEVTIADFPPRLEAYFPEGAITDEDRVKTEQYQAEARRKQLLAALKVEPGKPVFELLEIKLDIHELREDEIPRVSQLSQKANQFNVCTIRRSESEVRELAKAGMVIVAYAKDRFGDHGLIAYAAIKDGVIVDWVMSCRVMGRGIEERIEEQLECLSKQRGISSISAKWIKTERNVPVMDLFNRFGFRMIYESETERKYEKGL